jgi:tetratricopeptide (TPR) repeat protein
VSARDFYNAGTHLLAARKFAEAETLLDSALAAQDDRVQPPAMYNLGLTRFAEGVEFLQQGPDAAKASARGQVALTAGDHAIARAETALAGNDLDALVGAYLEGRGARHELHEAEKAVQAAMETYGKTLQKWQRADHDFKGAAELNPADTNATQNAAVTEQAIAKLIDSLRKMQGMMGVMDQKRQQLGQDLGKLKGRIPAPDAPPGAAEEGDDDDNGTTPGDLAGQKEGAAREGDQLEMQLSPEQAGQILDGLSLDGSRRLSMSDQQGSAPKDRKGRNW